MATHGLTWFKLPHVEKIPSAPAYLQQISTLVAASVAVCQQVIGQIYG